MICVRSRFDAISFIGGPLQPKRPEEEPKVPDLTGVVIPNTMKQHFDLIITDQSGVVKVPEIVAVVNGTPATIGLVPDPDPATGFTVLSVAGAEGPFEVAVDAGDSDLAPGVQTKRFLLQGTVVQQKLVADVTFVAGAQEPV